ncbi:hypothetical protein SASPL_104231 [Salvia splendens]|uniref:Uncharacterized protein n=1 Tax=Salvia splendens TaxID=180675 RepID=A0A8X8YME5_SALSN|nr:hypothetical protein SASPL_104231 [Salvia splendens]
MPQHRCAVPINTSCLAPNSFGSSFLISAPAKNPLGEDALRFGFLGFLFTAEVKNLILYRIVECEGLRSLWRCAVDFVGDFTMSRLLGLSGIRSLEQFKSLSGSSSRASNKKIMPNASLGTPESVSTGSFANLKLTAEKLVREQASARTDLELADFLKKKRYKLERENKDLLSSRDDFSDRLQLALLEVKNLEEFVTMLVEKFKELERKSLAFSENFIQLNALFDSCSKLAQQEKDLVSKCAQRKFDQINDQCASAVSEKNALHLDNHELKNKILELQKEQEFSMVQHAEECRLAEEKIQKLESEAALVSKQSEMHVSILKLEDNLRVSSENCRISEEKVVEFFFVMLQDLSMKLSELELSSKGLIDGLNTEILKKQEESDVLQKEVEKREENTHLLEERVKELENTVEEKEQLLVELKTREEQIGNQKAEVMASLADTESKLQEAKKEYNHMFESKHLELSKHLKEISQRNDHIHENDYMLESDQAINDIRMKYEVEKLETVNLEKEKADKIIQDLEKRCEQKVEEIKEESRQRLLQVQEEHAAAVSNIHKEHAKRETLLTSKHTEELRRTELHAEAELREKRKMLRSEHEAQLRALRCEHEDECKRLEEELDIQEEKNYSITSKMRNKESNKRIQQSLDRAEVDEKVSPNLN